MQDKQRCEHIVSEFGVYKFQGKSVSVLIGGILSVYPGKGQTDIKAHVLLRI